MRIVIRGINPEPWAIGTTYGYGSKSGISPHPKVVNYQNAIREELKHLGFVGPGFSWPTELTIYYFRSTEHGHPADVTNLNKATEDALQELVFTNDRVNFKVTGEIMEQHKEVKNPGLVIFVSDYEQDQDLYDELSDLIQPPEVVAFAGSNYTPPEEDPFA